jgi:hypothetical protein
VDDLPERGVTATRELKVVRIDHNLWGGYERKGTPQCQCKPVPFLQTQYSDFAPAGGIARRAVPFLHVRDELAVARRRLGADFPVYAAAAFGLKHLLGAHLDAVADNDEATLSGGWEVVVDRPQGALDEFRGRIT